MIIKQVYVRSVQVDVVTAYQLGVGSDIEFLQPLLLRCPKAAFDDLEPIQSINQSCNFKTL